MTDGVVTRRTGRALLWLLLIAIPVSGLVASVADDYSTFKLLLALSGIAVALFATLALGHRVRGFVVTDDSEGNRPGYLKHIVVIALAYLIARQLSDVIGVGLLAVATGFFAGSAIVVERYRSRSQRP